MKPAKRHALRMLRRERQRQAVITRQQEDFQDYLWRHRTSAGLSNPRRIGRGLKRWPQGEMP